MKDNDNNDYRPIDGQHRYKYFKNKHGEEWVFKPSRKPKDKSYTSLVLEYLHDEWGLQQSMLSNEAIERLMEMIEFAEYEGNNPSNSAAMVMEAMWQHGLERPTFDDTN